MQKPISSSIPRNSTDLSPLFFSVSGHSKAPDLTQLLHMFQMHQHTSVASFAHRKNWLKVQANHGGTAYESLHLAISMVFYYPNAPWHIYIINYFYLQNWVILFGANVGIHFPYIEHMGEETMVFLPPFTTNSTFQEFPVMFVEL